MKDRPLATAMIIALVVVMIVFGLGYLYLGFSGLW